MDWLEQELRDALNRKDPSPDFAERVRWSLHVQKHRPAHGLQWWLATAAAFVIVAGAGGIGYRQHQGEEARREVMQAFRIAGASLNHIQTQVREVRR
jgi:hypothetical protein